MDYELPKNKIEHIKKRYIGKRFFGVLLELTIIDVFVRLEKSQVILVYNTTHLNNPNMASKSVSNTTLTLKIMREIMRYYGIPINHVGLISENCIEYVIMVRCVPTSSSQVKYIQTAGYTATDSFIL